MGLGRRLGDEGGDRGGHGGADSGTDQRALDSEDRRRRRCRQGGEGRGEDLVGLQLHAAW